MARASHVKGPRLGIAVVSGDFVEIRRAIVGVGVRRRLGLVISGFARREGDFARGEGGRKCHAEGR